MRNSLIFIFLFIAHIGKAQARKEDIVIEIDPKVFDLVLSKDNQIIKFESSCHYYLSDKLAVGFGLGVNNFWSFYQNYMSSSHTYLLFRLAIRPEVRYNFMATKLTPFVKMGLGSINYERVVNTSEIYSKSQTIYSIKIFEPKLEVITTIGLSYFLKEHFALQASLNFDAANFNKTGFGLSALFILSKHGEILNPKNM